MRPSRLILGTMLACALAPGTWWRAPEPPRTFEQLTTIMPLDLGVRRSGPFTLLAGWEMAGDPFRFGGLSALVALDEERFLSGTDGGLLLAFERPDRSDEPGVLSVIGEGESAAKLGRDLESLAVDQATGTVWAGYEFRNAILRLDANLDPDEEVQPEEMEEWGENAGPEALVRLADGRFLVIEERAQSWRSTLYNALLFDGDPVEASAPERATIRLPEGYRPVDATATEEGRALVLLRRVEWGVPPIFHSALAEVDTRKTGDDGTLDVRILTVFGTAIPQDNYEGLAITRDPDGTHVWMVSDDNFMTLQRTLLLKLRWDQREKARE
ncbi:esterase-like activity of phytase family protein [Qipengyuania flava]|uniref:esterase-like activity of phytase family protein n=1 Tax=Qipengyuania flava TaxID=192812 RepID=UPI001C635C85|nr:esterase-like activity of phytase family protein [Qipengyuania flava]QYJ07365.1 esterase-like activity of phytase family protein [Qipengyuania flava]